MGAEKTASEKRRELLAKTTMDIAKIMLGAIFAGGLLINLDVWSRLLLASTVLILLAAGYFISPNGGA